MAAGNSTLNLALRITADLNDAKQALGTLTSDITATGTAADNSSRKWGDHANAVEGAAAAAREHAQAEKGAADSTRATGDVAQQTAESYHGYQRALNQTREAANAAQNTIEDLTTDLATQQAALAALVGRIDPVVGAYERLDAMEEQLKGFHASGLLPGEELDLYAAKVDGMRLQVEKAAYAATEAGRREIQIARETAQAEAQAATAKEAFITRLREQAETLNMTTTELLQYKAAQLGITAEAAPFIQRINEQATAMGHGGISAGQYSQAMRILPMQITDVVTSLASGMPIWMVAIQQGGQIKDSFGGVGNTFRALTSLITPARLAIGGIAGGVAALGIAAFSAANDQDEFNNSIQQTGNFAGVSVGQLQRLTQAGGQMSSNYSQVRDILNGLVSSGKFTGETLDSVSQAASAMAELTGDSADQVVAEFVKMTNSVSDWAVNSSEQYHWLDSETYQRIRALEDQGLKEDAIELASQAYKKAAVERLGEIKTQLNWVARGWDDVKNAAAEAWQGLKSGTSSALNLDAPDEARAKEIQNIKEQLANAGDELDIATRGPAYGEWVKEQKARLSSLEAQAAAQQKIAAEATKRQQIEDKSNAASKELEKTWASNRTAVEKEADALDSLKKRYTDMWAAAGGREKLRDLGVSSTDGQNFSGGQWDADVKALDQSGKKAEQYNKQLQQTLNQKKAITQLARVEADITNGSLKDASKVEQDKARATARQIDAQEAANKSAKAGTSAAKQSAAENQRFVDQLEKQASKRVEGAAATRAQEIATRNLTAEQRRQAEAANAAITAQEFKGQNLQLQLQLMRDTGNTAGASLLETQSKFADMRREFEASGNTEGLSLIDKLLPVAETKIRVDDMKKQIEDLFTYQAQQETSIQAQVQGGLLNEIQGRQRLLELHQEVGDKVKGYLPQLKELANAPGEAGEKIRDMIRQLEEQLGKLNQAGNELTIAFRDGLQGGIESSLVGLAKGTMNLSDAVKNLALSIVNSMAQIAAQQLAQMATSSLVGSGGGMGGLFASVFAADGGHVRGPGTTTSDSIPSMLSDYEFVTRAAVVQQPGALDFLHSFNRHGMAALNAWLPRARHATGGLAGIPAPAAPMPQTVPEAAPGSPAPGVTMLQPLQQTLLIDAVDVFTKGAGSVQGERGIMTVLRANIPTLKQMLGVKS
ncbi:Phage-related minor tail protein [Serratia marcescens]|uniref:phage tail length tape measure family protein n=1 Tax=Serratia marcescens TaxID=615 RepID=UPI00217875A9|nr:phage tail length tape measure family protein [Serratia marcescens]CAI1927719.1 Phage-related minor tail protein [Serratia marcescens]